MSRYCQQSVNVATWSRPDNMKQLQSYHHKIELFFQFNKERKDTHMHPRWGRPDAIPKPDDTKGNSETADRNVITQCESMKTIFYESTIR